MIHYWPEDQALADQLHLQLAAEEPERRQSDEDGAALQWEWDHAD